MTTFGLFIIISVIAIAFYTVVTAFRLQKNVVIPATSAYFYFILAANCYGLLNWLGPHLLFESIRSPGEEEYILHVLIVMSVISIPFLLFKMYFFMRTSFELVERNLPKTLQKGYYFFAALSFLFLLIRIKGYLDQRSEEALLSYLLSFGLIAVGFQFAVIFHTLFYARRLNEERKRQAVTRFGVMYLVGFFVYVLAAYSSHWWNSEVLIQVIPFCYFVMHVPPLLSLKISFETYYRKHPVTPVRASDKKSFQEFYNITERESTIMELLAEGKNNREIAEKLFISPHTVKNHVYNIYKKVGVKNKLQLIFAISIFDKKQDSE